MCLDGLAVPAERSIAPHPAKWPDQAMIVMRIIEMFRDPSHDDAIAWIVRRRALASVAVTLHLESLFSSVKESRDFNA
jgi:hypothetical protein